MANAPFDFGIMLVLSANAFLKGRVQIAYYRVNNTIAIRWLNNTWSPWEYQNPPMQIGVEYRTTERHMGKPVYVKLVNFGALPNATTKELGTGISIAYSIVDRAVYSINPGGYGVVDMNRFQLEDKITAGSTSWVYSVVSTSDYSAYTTTYVTFKYTKTTD